MDTVITSLLERLLATSVQTGLLTVVVWMLCRHVPRLSPASQCWLWWLVALQALLGLAANPVELAWLPHSPAATPEALTATQSITVDPGATAVPSLAVRDWISWQSTLVLLWVSGSLIMAWFTMREWLRGNALLKGSSACNDEHLLQALERAAGACELRSPPDLRLSLDIESPLLIGYLRPMLLLPASASLSDEELDMALIHELTHLRRNDLWWGFVPALARHLFFFHPFAHLAVREYGIARESACDTAVVNSAHLCRQNYGRLLLRLGAAPQSRAGLAVSSPTFHSLRRRLAMLQNTSFLPRTASMVVVVIAAAGVMPFRLVAAADTPATLNPVATPTENGLPTVIGAQTAVDDEIAKLKTQLQRPQEAGARADNLPQESAKRNQITNQGPEVEQEYEQLVRENELTKSQVDQQTNARITIRQAFAMDAVVDDRVKPDGTPLDPTTYGKPICRVTRDGGPALDAAGRESNDLEELRQLAKGCQPLNIFGASYKIAPGTVLQILVLRNPELSTTVPVLPDGRISTPLVENIVAAGKTPSQLARDIEVVLAQFVRSPKVTVIVKGGTVKGPLGDFTFRLP